MEAPNSGGLETSSIAIGERAFRQTHLEPWRARLGPAGALMTEASEQTVDGIVVHGSRRYLTELLRDELYRARPAGRKERLGLFENPYVDPDRAERVVNCVAHRELALRCARQSLVLLNREALQADVAVVVVGEQSKGGYFSPDRTDGEPKEPPGWT